MASTHTSNASQAEQCGAIICSGVRLIVDKQPPSCYALDGGGRVIALHEATDRNVCAAAVVLDALCELSVGCECLLQPSYATLDELRQVALGEVSASLASEIFATHLPGVSPAELSHVSMLPLPYEARPSSPGAGMGLFATQRIASCVVLGEYTGVVSRDDASRCTADDDAYRVALPATTPDGVALHISARAIGSPMRLINHGPTVAWRHAGPGMHGPGGPLDPRLANCAFVPVVVRGLPRILVVTLRCIVGGEELLADYGEQYWRARHASGSTWRCR